MKKQIFMRNDIVSISQGKRRTKGIVVEDQMTPNFVFIKTKKGTDLYESRKVGLLERKKAPYATMKDKPSSYLKGNKLVGEASSSSSLHDNAGDMSLEDIHRAGNQLDSFLDQMGDRDNVSDEQFSQVQNILHDFLDKIDQDDFMRDDPEVRRVIQKAVQNHIISPVDAKRVLGESKKERQLRLMENLYNQFYSYLEIFYKENRDRSAKKYYRTKVTETANKFVSEIRNNPNLLVYSKSQSLLEDIGYTNDEIKEILNEINIKRAHELSGKHYE